MIKETLIYFSEDKELCKLSKEINKCKLIPYSTPDHKIINGITSIEGTNLLIFGKHNLQNLNAAKLVCNEIGVSDNDFYHNIATFKGASNRLELVQQNTNSALYKDFAHSPSKLKATSFAMKKQFNNRELVACMELHTFSSLNEEFLKEYKGCMHDADIAIVYFNPKSIALKKIKRITKNKIIHAFDRHDLLVFTNSMKLEKYLKGLKWKNRNLLMMSSGNFNEIDFNNLIKERPN